MEAEHALHHEAEDPLADGRAGPRRRTARPSLGGLGLMLSAATGLAAFASFAWWNSALVHRLDAALVVILRTSSHEDVFTVAMAAGAAVGFVMSLAGGVWQLQRGETRAARSRGLVHAAWGLAGLILCAALEPTLAVLYTDCRRPLCS